MSEKTQTNQKLLDIPFKNGSYLLPLYEISDGHYCLKNIDSYSYLKEALSKWIKENKSSTYDSYNHFMQTYMVNNIAHFL